MLPLLLLLVKLDASTLPQLNSVNLQPIPANIGSVPRLNLTNLPHLHRLSGHITPPAPSGQNALSVSPHGNTVMSQPVSGAYAMASVPSISVASANASIGTTPSSTLPHTAPPTTVSGQANSGPEGAANTVAATSGTFSAPSYMPSSDYFSYRATGNASAHTATATSVPPLPYNIYKRTNLILLLLDSILRMLLATNIAQHAEQSPVPQQNNRLSLFSHESANHAVPMSAYPTSMGPILYTHSGAPLGYPSHMAPQGAVRGATSTGMAGITPVTFGIPPLGQAVLQPYGILIASPYGQMMVGPGVGAGAGAIQEQIPSKLVTDQNYALMNKRRVIKRRTRTGCLTCRKRRIKCDERKPHCFNCERLKKLCLGYEVLPTSAKRCDAENVGKHENASHRSSVHDLL